MKTVLFVCSGNICRGPMAETIFEDLVDDHPRLRELDISASSAGTLACEGAEMHEYAQRALDSLGVEPPKHYKARMVDDEMLGEADLILCMQEQNIEEVCAINDECEPRTHTLKGFACGKNGLTGTVLYDIEDPFREPLEGYIECAEEIKKYLIKVTARLDKEW